MEEVRQREANLTALQAIGPRKKIKLEGTDGQSAFVSIFHELRCLYFSQTRVQKLPFP